MNEKANYALVGVFVVTLGAALVGISLWLSVAQRPIDYVTYVAHMTESVSGLNEQAPVKYRGVDVGRVRDIALDTEDPSRVRLLLDIEPDTPIKTDTMAILASQGITGIAYVELTGGSRGAPSLAAASDLPYPEIPTGPSLLVRLDTAISALLAELSQASRELRAVAEHVATLVDSQNVAATREILDNVRTLTTTLAAQATTLAGGAESAAQISSDAARVSRELPELVAKVRDTLGALQRTASAIADATSGVNALATDARRSLNEVTQGTVPQMSRALAEIRELAQTLNRLGQELERDPSVLLRGRKGQRRGPGE